MSYKNDFPGMSKFQAINGGKGVTAPSGIIPFNTSAMRPSAPARSNFFASKLK